MVGEAPFRVQELVDRFESAYGPAAERRGSDPIDELVSCILSQHTTDTASFPTFEELKSIYSTWDEVVHAGVDQLAITIRRAGLANQKAKTIISCLQRIREHIGGYSLQFLSDLSPIEARNWLCALPGIGPKTASIVLCFSFGMGVVPVDTHVHRVALRLGALPPKTGANAAHDQLMVLVSADVAYRFHMALIQHGRQVCRARQPLCGQCCVRDLCRWPAT